jgi:hypothetical protein
MMSSKDPGLTTWTTLKPSRSAILTHVPCHPTHQLGIGPGNWIYRVPQVGRFRGSISSRLPFCFEGASRFQQREGLSSSLQKHSEWSVSWLQEADNFLGDIVHPLDEEPCATCPNGTNTHGPTHWEHWVPSLVESFRKFVKATRVSNVGLLLTSFNQVELTYSDTSI